MIQEARQWLVDNLIDIDGIENVVQSARSPDGLHAETEIWGNVELGTVNVAFVFPKDIKPIKALGGTNLHHYITFECQFIMSYKDAENISGSTQEKFDLTLDNILTGFANNLLDPSLVHDIQTVDPEGMVLMGEEGIMNFQNHSCHAVKWEQRIKTRLT